MRSFFALVGVLGGLCLGCPPERRIAPPPLGNPPGPGHPQMAGYPGQGVPTTQQPPTPPAQPYPQHGYAMPQAAPRGPVPGQPGGPTQPAPTAPQPVAEPLQPLPPLGEADPGGAAFPIDVRHMHRAQPALEQLAARNMINMKPDDEAFAAQFNNGQVYEQDIVLEPGRCYGVVAVSTGITEFDMALVIGEPPVDHVMGKDELKGWQGVIGTSGQCVHVPLPTAEAGKIRITAVAGAGQVIARIYSK